MRHEHIALQCLDIANKGDEPDTVMGDVKGFEISADRKKILMRKGDDFYILDSDVKPRGTGRCEGAGEGGDQPVAVDVLDEAAR